LFRNKSINSISFANFAAKRNGVIPSLSRRLMSAGRQREIERQQRERERQERHQQRDREDRLRREQEEAGRRERNQ